MKNDDLVSRGTEFSLGFLGWGQFLASCLPHYAPIMSLALTTQSREIWTVLRPTTGSGASPRFNGRKLDSVSGLQPGTRWSRVLVYHLRASPLRRHYKVNIGILLCVHLRAIVCIPHLEVHRGVLEDERAYLVKYSNHDEVVRRLLILLWCDILHAGRPNCKTVLWQKQCEAPSDVRDAIMRCSCRTQVNVALLVCDASPKQTSNWQSNTTSIWCERLSALVGVCCAMVGPVEDERRTQCDI